MGKYNGWTRGDDEALLNKLGGLCGLDGEYVARQFLNDRFNLELSLAPWAKIDFGMKGNKSLWDADMLTRMMIQADCQWSGYAERMLLGNPDLNGEVFGLVLLTPKDLGFKDKCLIGPGDANQAAIHMGLALCPPEIGPMLCIRSAYGSIPKLSKVIVGMEPLFIQLAGGDCNYKAPRIWHIQPCGKGFRLTAIDSGLLSLCDQDAHAFDYFVYALPRDRKVYLTPRAKKAK